MTHKRRFKYQNCLAYTGENKTPGCHSSTGYSEKGKQNRHTILIWMWPQEHIHTRPGYPSTLRTEGPTFPTPERSTEVSPTASRCPTTHGIKFLTSDLKINQTKPKKTNKKLTKKTPTKTPPTWGVCWCTQRPTTREQQQSKREVSRSQPPRAKVGTQGHVGWQQHRQSWLHHTHTHRSLFWYCFISILEFHSFNTEALFHYTKMSLMFMSKCFFSPQRTFCYRKSWVQNKNKGMDCHCAVDMGGRTFSSASHGKEEECGQEARWQRRATSDTSKSRSSHWFPQWLGFFAYF